MAEGNNNSSLCDKSTNIHKVSVPGGDLLQYQRTQYSIPVNDVTQLYTILYQQQALLETLSAQFHEHLQQTKVHPCMGVPQVKIENKRCYRCFQPGHLMRNCWKEVNYRGNQRDNRNDKRYQSYSWRFEKNNNYYGRHQVQCTFCQKWGHQAQACVWKNRLCFFCKGTDHQIRECRKLKNRKKRKHRRKHRTSHPVQLVEALLPELQSEKEIEPAKLPDLPIVKEHVTVNHLEVDKEILEAKPIDSPAVLQTPEKEETVNVDVVTVGTPSSLPLVENVKEGEKADVETRQPSCCTFCGGNHPLESCQKLKKAKIISRQSSHCNYCGKQHFLENCMLYQAILKKEVQKDNEIKEVNEKEAIEEVTSKVVEIEIKKPSEESLKLTRRERIRRERKCFYCYEKHYGEKCPSHRSSSYMMAAHEWERHHGPI